jgi:hypothetical protein
VLMSLSRAMPRAFAPPRSSKWVLLRSLPTAVRLRPTRSWPLDASVEPKHRQAVLRTGLRPMRTLADLAKFDRANSLLSGRGTACRHVSRAANALLATAFCVISMTLGVLSAGSAVGRPLVPAERRYVPYYAELPACNDPAVFERIQGRFHDREVEYWHTGLEIAGFDNVSEIGFRSNGLDYIPRRYCIAQAYMSDTVVRSVSYSINEDLGIIGINFGVEWCVAGLDRHDAYAPDCKMARP